MATLTMRPYAGEADLAPITELLNLCDAADRLDDNYAIDDLRVEFADPRLDPANDMRLWEDGDGRLVAFGQTWINREGDKIDGSLYWRVLPSARGAGLEDEIMAWGCERIRAAGQEAGKPAVIFSFTRDHDQYSQDVLRRHAMAPVRYFFRMTRPLDEPIADAELPEGFVLRHVVSDADVAGWVEAFNQSFIDHWNFHPMTVEGHRHWLQHPAYRAERDLIAEAPDGTIAAFCFCEIDPEDNARNNRNEGWIGILGTRRGFRKLGLGRAMLLHGLRRLKADGVDTAKLNVDAENPTGALRLYESVGFRVAQRGLSYSKELV
jgi:ribosomal protein S18 acetylase RimI-like enzyme